MHRFVVIGAGLLSIAGLSAASAADLPARIYTKAPPMIAAIYDWSGFYLGLNAGGAGSRGCWNLTSIVGLPPGATPSEGCNTATGAVVGGQVGYRWQSASWVFGVEAQGDWADLKGSNASLTAVIPYNNFTKVDAIGLFTGQVGYAWNNALLYVKGGAAVTENNYSSSFPVGNIFAAAGVPFNSASDTHWAVPSAQALSTASCPTGRWPSNTIICSWAGPASSSPPRRSPSREPTPSVSLSTWERSA
jgi:outer membrane immunogenic protein